MKKLMLFLSIISSVGIVSCGKRFSVLEVGQNYMLQQEAKNCHLPKDEQHKIREESAYLCKNDMIGESDIRELAESKEIALKKDCNACRRIVKMIEALEAKREEAAQEKTDYAELLAQVTQ